MTSAPLRVALLGAGGTIAPPSSGTWRSREEVESILLLDLDGERAPPPRARTEWGRARAQAVDARGRSSTRRWRDATCSSTRPATA